MDRVSASERQMLPAWSSSTWVARPWRSSSVPRRARPRRRHWPRPCRSSMPSSSRRSHRAGTGPAREPRLEVPALLLFALDRFEQRLEVADAEAARAVALDDLEEERRAILDGAGEDLQ